MGNEFYSCARLDSTNPVVISRHAEQRLRQRGFSRSDLALVMNHGAPIEDGIELTNRVAAERIAELKREVQALERLRGTRVIVLGEVIATTYRIRYRRRYHQRRRPLSATCMRS